MYLLQFPVHFQRRFNDAMICVLIYFLFSVHYLFHETALYIQRLINMDGEFDSLDVMISQLASGLDSNKHNDAQSRTKKFKSKVKKKKKTNTKWRCRSPELPSDLELDISLEEELKFQPVLKEHNHVKRPSVDYQTLVPDQDIIDALNALKLGNSDSKKQLLESDDNLSDIMATFNPSPVKKGKVLKKKKAKREKKAGKENCSRVKSTSTPVDNGFKSIDSGISEDRYINSVELNASPLYKSIAIQSELYSDSSFTEDNTFCKNIGVQSDLYSDSSCIDDLSNVSVPGSEELFSSNGPSRNCSGLSDKPVELADVEDLLNSSDICRSSLNSSKSVRDESLDLPNWSKLSDPYRSLTPVYTQTASKTALYTSESKDTQYFSDSADSETNVVTVRKITPQTPNEISPQRALLPKSLNLDASVDYSEDTTTAQSPKAAKSRKSKETSDSANRSNGNESDVLVKSEPRKAARVIDDESSDDDFENFLSNVKTSTRIADKHMTSPEPETDDLSDFIVSDSEAVDEVVNIGSSESDGDDDHVIDGDQVKGIKSR